MDGDNMLADKVEMYRKMYGTLSRAIFEVADICTDKKCVEILLNSQMDADDIFIEYCEARNWY